MQGVTVWQGDDLGEGRGAALLQQDLTQLRALYLGYRGSHFRATSESRAHSTSEASAWLCGTTLLRSAAVNVISYYAPARGLCGRLLDTSAILPACAEPISSSLGTTAPETPAPAAFPPPPLTLSAAALCDRPPSLPVEPNCWFGLIVDEVDGKARLQPLSLFCEEAHSLVSTRVVPRNG